MKVQVSMTLELDAKDLKSYMSDLGCDDETVATPYPRSLQCCLKIFVTTATNQLLM